MTSRRALTLALGCVLLSSLPSRADKVTRSVDQDGNPKITIRGSEKPSAHHSEGATAPQKEFQVYELDGDGATPTEAAPAAPQVVIVGFPPPIAPNPAAFGYGYGFGFGFGYPGFGPICPPGLFYNNFPPGQPLNYQNPPVNYQNPPVNYQNPPVNYQPRVLPPPNQPRRWR
jgi:hypothetical protein